MKTPIYEQSPGALEALLETNRFVQADLYTYQLADGNGTLRYTSADLDVGYMGNTWSSAAPYHVGMANRPTAVWKTGIDVGTWQYTVSPRKTDPITGAMYPDTLLGRPWIEAAAAGVLDGATVTVDRAYFQSWSVDSANSWGLKGVSPVGVLRIFVGNVAAVDLLDGQVGITLNDLLWRLTLAMPRNYFQPGCRHTLFDTGCTLLASAFSVSGTVDSGSTRAAIVSACGNPPGSGTFALGQIKMTSGQNAGLRRAVRDWDGTTFTLMAPFVFPVNVGDTFVAYAGCDKKLATCALFGNSANFGGQPFIPAPEDSV